MRKLLLFLALALPAYPQFGNANRLQSRPLSATAPSDTYVICWDASASTWKPCPTGGSGTSIAGDVTGSLAASTVVKLQNRALASTAPSDTNTICWDAGGSTWKPCAGSVANSHTTFSNVASVAITVTGVADHAVVSCFDNSTPPQAFIPDHIQQTDANTLTVFFVPNATGYCNVATGVGATGATGATGPAGGVADPGSNGIMKRTALNVTAPAVANTDYLPVNDPTATGTFMIGTSLSFDAAAGVETGLDISTPANPAASHTKLYAKGGVWCSLSPAGAENCLGAGGGSPGGSGTELQYRSGASTFGGMAGTSWDSGTGTFTLINGDGNTVLTFSSDPLSLDPFTFNANQFIGPPSVAMGDGTPGSTVHFNAYLGGATTDPAGLGGNAGGIGFVSGAGGNGGAEGGYGGGVEFFAREGGNATAANGEGGGGGYVNITGGTGGNAANSGGVGGDGGDITITVGVAGTGAMTNGRDGRMIWANGSNGASVSWNIPSTITSYVLTPPLAQGTGAMTNDGAGNLSWTPISLSGTTGSIGGGLLAAGACASGTVAVTGSTTSMTVTVSPNTYPGDGTDFSGYVSTNGTVTVKVCALVAVTPTSSTYNVRVIQ